MFFIMFLVLSFLIALGFYKITGSVLKALDKNHKSGKVRILRGIAAIVLSAVCYQFRGLMIFALYLFIIYGIFVILRPLLKVIFKAFKNKSWYKVLGKIYKIGVVQVLLVALVLGYGVYNMNTPVKTQYTVTSDKLKSNLKIIFLSDVHYGTVQEPEVLKEAVKEINAQNPDLVIFGGDILEEGTTKEKMRECFRVLGGISTRCGKYYVYGNHDRQTYSQNPAYTDQELKLEMALHEIFPLKDQAVQIRDDILLVGREDSSVEFKNGKRAEINRLIGENQDKFIIVADHQPKDFESNAAAGVDLQLSGHTHAGQIFPMGTVANALGLMKQYGLYKVNDFTAVVSSGIGGWGFSIRTEKRSEYVVVNLLPQ